MKKGFTLAEVLITLGVIGVVAALTIPTVISKYQERVTVSKVKEIYSIMSQAFLLSVKDNGYANEWNVGNGENATTAIQIANYLKPYLKIAKDCGINSGCLKYTESTNLLNGKRHVNYDGNKNYYKMILLDGSYIFIRGTFNYCQTNEGGVVDSCGAIFIDMNGGTTPNTFGKDLFVFRITPFAIKPSIDNSCLLNSTGSGCSGYILKNNNMDYLH